MTRRKESMAKNVFKIASDEEWDADDQETKHLAFPDWSAIRQLDLHSVKALLKDLGIEPHKFRVWYDDPLVIPEIDGPDAKPRELTRSERKQILETAEATYLRSLRLSLFYAQAQRWAENLSVKALRQEYKSRGIKLSTWEKRTLNKADAIQRLLQNIPAPTSSS
jgi:hypothetical protein